MFETATFLGLARAVTRWRRPHGQHGGAAIGDFPRLAILAETDLERHQLGLGFASPLV